MYRARRHLFRSCGSTFSEVGHCNVVTVTKVGGDQWSYRPNGICRSDIFVSGTINGGQGRDRGSDGDGRCATLCRARSALGYDHFLHPAAEHDPATTFHGLPRCSAVFSDDPRSLPCSHTDHLVTDGYRMFYVLVLMFIKEFLFRCG